MIGRKQQNMPIGRLLGAREWVANNKLVQNEHKSGLSNQPEEMKSVEWPVELQQQDSRKR